MSGGVKNRRWLAKARPHMPQNFIEREGEPMPWRTVIGLVGSFTMGAIGAWILWGPG